MVTILLFHVSRSQNDTSRIVRCLSIDKVNLLQMDKLNNSVDVLQKPTLNGTLNGTSLKYLNMV